MSTAANAIKVLKKITAAGARTSKHAVIDPLAGRAKAAFPEAESVCLLLVESVLVWEAGRHFAARMFEELSRSFVDLNEMRVADDRDLVQIFGASDTQAARRAWTLRSLLKSVCLREQVLSLSSLQAMAAPQAMQALRSINGLPPFVFRRVQLLALGGAGCPIDDRLHSALRRQHAIPDDVEPAAASDWIAKHVPAACSVDGYQAMETWWESGAASLTAPNESASTRAAGARARAKPRTRVAGTKDASLESMPPADAHG